ncbi:hypothetical protein LF65_05436 [Clostridium beijerinckii]|uniref:HTH araC/xylS-type domain-containing protein n=1 Tax=Clostridium beijerinckii TaxID=1520 RepID=A0A0B5QVF1_CLOBE|nr:AraC family transcriptional regulator [Clostridium beijerinckii]AJH01953.1 hypothetical protein LF65_05436 [Clostridium beijerinckii]
MLDHLPRTSVGFKFLSQISLILIKGVGCQNIKSHDYIWDGKSRKDYFWHDKQRKDNHCLLQYTLSGEGEIEVKGNVYKLREGDAFLVDIPSDHCYRLPNSSSEWEVIYIEFSKEAVSLFHKIYNIKGHIIHLERDCGIVKSLINIYEIAVEDKLKDIYQNSKYAYELIMDLISYFSDESKNKILPSKIELGKKFIDENYNKPIGLEDITEYVNLSKYHFSREFEKEMGITPGKYLTKVRIEKAIDLLIFSKTINIEEIAKEIGFNCGNYFSKVFKKTIGISPLEFRNNNISYDINRIFFDK